MSQCRTSGVQPGRRVSEETHGSSQSLAQLFLRNNCTLQSCLGCHNQGPRYSSGSLRTSQAPLAFHQLLPLFCLSSSSSLSQGSMELQGPGTEAMMHRAVMFLPLGEGLCVIMYHLKNVFIYKCIYKILYI